MQASVKVQVLPGTNPYQSQYSADAHGFSTGWWDGVSQTLSRSMHHLSFTVDGAEVVRARVYQPGSVAAEYENFDRHSPCTEIYRFETNISTRRRGYGRASV